MQTAPLIGMSRHRLSIDGEGVTTLVAFHGCPLRCKYCLNDSCLRPDGIRNRLSTQELYEKVRVDNLYFLATGGGVTFGGGEPCLQSLFIEEFARIMDSHWRITIETCLNVDRTHLERLLPVASQWFIDIKDMNPGIYQGYTGKNNQQVKDNLRWLLSHDGLADKMIVRLPLIPGHNTTDDVRKSRSELEMMGVRHFDEFEYVVKTDLPADHLAL